MDDGMDYFPGRRAVEASMPGKSKLMADAAERAALRGLSKSEQRGGPGAGDPADAGRAAGRGDRGGSRCAMTAID